MVATIAAHTAAGTAPKGPVGARRPICLPSRLPGLEVKTSTLGPTLELAGQTFARIRERDRPRSYDRG